jgi:hypothetical protein
MRQGIPMAEERKRLLGNLVPNDIFHAECPSGASLVCLVTSVTDAVIRARRMTTGENLEFDRRTGVTQDGGTPCAINSVAPLPVEIHNVMLGIDRKSRLEHLPERHKLTDAEKRAFAFIEAHYASNPI